MGLIDGLYIKCGGKNYEDLDFYSIGFQFKLLFIIQIFLFLILCFFLNTMSSERRFIILMCCISIIVSNLSSFLGFILQAVSQMKHYALGRFVSGLSFVWILLIFIVTTMNNFKAYIIVFILCQLVECFIYCRYNKKILVAAFYSKNNKKNVLDFFSNIKIGINILLSTFVGLFILGIGRYVIDERWGVIEFAKVSFFLTFSSFFMSFVTQASYAFLPELVKEKEDNIGAMFLKVKSIIQLISPVILLFYLPICIFVKYLLPKYYGSVNYLIILLPICMFDSKMQFLFVTYFKKQRKERSLLLCNICSFILATIFVCISAYIMKSTYAVVASMLIAIIFRSILAEKMLIPTIKLYHYKLYKSVLPEILVVTVFVLLNFGFNKLIAAFMFAVAISFYFLFYRIHIKQILIK